jgi:hypothetical protein
VKWDFSEFTYGYALVPELRDRKILNLNVTPIYPSLHREARLGYDAKIKTKHGAFFLPTIQTFRGVDWKKFLPIYRWQL